MKNGFKSGMKPAKKNLHTWWKIKAIKCLIWLWEMYWDFISSSYVIRKCIFIMTITLAVLWKVALFREWYRKLDHKWYSPYDSSKSGTYLKWLKYNLPVHVNEGLSGMPRLEKNRPEGSDARTLVECLINKNWKGKSVRASKHTKKRSSNFSLWKWQRKDTVARGTALLVEEV